MKTTSTSSEWLKLAWAYFTGIASVLAVMDFQFGTSVTTGVMHGVVLSSGQRTEVIGKLVLFCLFLALLHLAAQWLCGFGARALARNVKHFRVREN